MYLKQKVALNEKGSRKRPEPKITQSTVLNLNINVWLSLKHLDLRDILLNVIDFSLSKEQN